MSYCVLMAESLTIISRVIFCVFRLSLQILGFVSQLQLHFDACVLSSFVFPFELRWHVAGQPQIYFLCQILKEVCSFQPLLLDMPLDIHKLFDHPHASTTNSPTAHNDRVHWRCDTTSSWLNWIWIMLIYSYHHWLEVEPTHLKNISQNGNLPQIAVKIKNIWNHHPDHDWRGKNPGSYSVQHVAGRKIHPENIDIRIWIISGWCWTPTLLRPFARHLGSGKWSF